MNWEAIGAVGEILGAAGVIITLAYLAVQIRQNTKVARSTVRQSIAESAQSLSADIISSPDMAEILIRDMNGEELTQVESLRMQGRCYRDMQHWENIFFQMREGLLPQEEWSGFRNNLAALMVIPSYREYWKQESSLYSKSFQREMAIVLEELESDPGARSIIGRFKSGDDET